MQKLIKTRRRISEGNTLHGSQTASLSVLTGSTVTRAVSAIIERGDL